MTDGNRRPRDADAITFECELDSPPQTVWRALTEPELLAAWLMADPIGGAEDGRAARLDFAAEGHSVEIETIAVEPHRMLRCRWRGLDGDGAGALFDSIVTFTLSETEAGGTRLGIVHDRFRVVARAEPAETITLRTRARPPSGGEKVMRLAA